MTVFPRRTGLMMKRQISQCLNKFGAGPIPSPQRRSRVETLHRRVAGETVGQSRCMTEKVLNRDRPFNGSEFQLAVLLDAYLHSGEFRNEFCEWVGEEQAP